jgi:hypothetical protein
MDETAPGRLRAGPGDDDDEPPIGEPEDDDGDHDDDDDDDAEPLWVGDLNGGVARYVWVGLRSAARGR